MLFEHGLVFIEITDMKKVIKYIINLYKTPQSQFPRYSWEALSKKKTNQHKIKLLNSKSMQDRITCLEDGMHCTCYMMR